MNEFENKKILILGLGITGKEVVKLASLFSCGILIVDDNYHKNNYQNIKVLKQNNF